MSDLNKEHNETNMEDMIKLYKKLLVQGITLLVIGVLGVVGVIISFIVYAIRRASNYAGISFGVAIYYLISVVILSVMISSGMYMLKSAKLLKTGVSNIINKEAKKDE